MIINFDRIGQGGGGSGSGSTVSWRQDLSAGTQIAQITINGRSQSVYAPSGSTYELPAATDQVLGGVKIGSGITVAADGTISVEGGGSGTVVYSASTATTQAEWGVIFNALSAMTEEERQNVVIYYYNGEIRPAVAWNGAARLTYTHFENNEFLFNGIEQVQGGAGSYTGPVAIALAITSNSGNITLSQLPVGIKLSIDGNHNLSTYRTSYSWFSIVRTLVGADYEVPPVVLKLKFNDVYYDEDYQRSGNTAYVYFNETISGTNYNAVWTITVDGQNLVSWTEEQGGQGGGIEKVSELPATANTGDVVWLNGKTYTGYTILCATDPRPAYVYEMDRSNVAIDGNETSARLGNFNTGAWVSWEGVMVRPRVQETTDYPLLDVIDPDGTHTIAVGENAISMETGVTFPMKGCLYEYRADGWFRKARFEHIYEGAADGLALIQKIQYGIEEFGFEDFVLRFSPDIYGEREFVPYISTNYGIDFQATDSRNREQDWGKISCRNYRLSASDGSFQDMVGNHWFVSEDQISIPQVVGVNINSAGTITEANGLDLLSNMFNVSNRVCFHCNLEADNKFSSAPLKWWYRQNEQVDGDTKLVYYACAEIPIEGTVYKGVWKWAEYQYPDPFVPQSWTAIQ